MLWMQVNPNYRLDNKMDETQFKLTHTGAKEEPTDKVYFRKADEVSKFAEAMFKSKILVTKKWFPFQNSYTYIRQIRCQILNCS